MNFHSSPSQITKAACSRLPKVVKGLDILTGAPGRGNFSSPVLTAAPALYALDKKGIYSPFDVLAAASKICGDTFTSANLVPQAGVSGMPDFIGWK